MLRAIGDAGQMQRAASCIVSRHLHPSVVSISVDARPILGRKGAEALGVAAALALPENRQGRGSQSGALDLLRKLACDAAVSAPDAALFTPEIVAEFREHNPRVRRRVFEAFAAANPRREPSVGAVNKWFLGWVARMYVGSTLIDDLNTSLTSMRIGGIEVALPAGVFDRVACGTLFNRLGSPHARGAGKGSDIDFKIILDDARLADELFRHDASWRGEFASFDEFYEAFAAALPTLKTQVAVRLHHHARCLEREWGGLELEVRAETFQTLSEVRQALMQPAEKAFFASIIFNSSHAGGDEQVFMRYQAELDAAFLDSRTWRFDYVALIDLVREYYLGSLSFKGTMRQIRALPTLRAVARQLLEHSLAKEPSPSEPLFAHLEATFDAARFTTEAQVASSPSGKIAAQLCALRELDAAGDDATQRLLLLLKLLRTHSPFDTVASALPDAQCLHVKTFLLRIGDAFDSIVPVFERLKIDLHRHHRLVSENHFEALAHLCYGLRDLGLDLQNAHPQVEAGLLLPIADLELIMADDSGRCEVQRSLRKLARVFESFLLRMQEGKQELFRVLDGPLVAKVQHALVTVRGVLDGGVEAGQTMVALKSCEEVCEAVPPLMNILEVRKELARRVSGERRPLRDRKSLDALPRFASATR